MLGLCALLASLALHAPPADAQDTLSVFPSIIEGDDVLRGGTFAREITITSPGSETDLRLALSARDDIVDWLRFTDPETRTQDLSEVVAPAGGTTRVLAEFTIPDDAVNGEYRGLILVEAMPVVDLTAGESETGVGLTVGVSVSLNVTGDQVREGSVVDVFVDPAEVGLPQRFTATVRNAGNVRIEPRVDVRILGADAPVAEISSGGEFFVVEPGGDAAAYAVWDTSEARAGDHVAEFTVVDIAGGDEIELGTATVPFRLEPRGTLTRSATFVELLLGNAPEVGAEARIEAYLQNSGQIEVQAILAASVSVNGGPTASFNSLSKVVLPDTTGRIELTFAVDEPGDYVVEALVNYDGLETETRSLSFTALPAGTSVTETDGEPGSAATTASGTGGGTSGGGSGLSPAIIAVVAVGAALVVGGGGLFIRKPKATGRHAA